MKKILSVLLAVVLVASLFACGPVEKEDITANPIAKADIKVGVIHIGDPADGIVALAVVLTIDCVTESNSGASVTVSSN